MHYRHDEQVTASQVLATLDQLPLQPITTLIEPGPILVVAPHPDDESLGCGGLIAAACEAGTPPYIVVVTDGGASHPNSRRFPPARLCQIRVQEVIDAAAELGLPQHHVSFLNLPDTKSPMDGPAFDEAASALATLARRHAAATILAPWQHDPHCDHVSAHRLAATAANAGHLTHLSYPVWGLTLPPETRLPGPLPTGFRIDITATLAAKRRAISRHRSQYAGLIDDDPAGFQLSADFLALFKRPFETYLANKASGATGSLRIGVVPSSDPEAAQ